MKARSLFLLLLLPLLLVQCRKEEECVFNMFYPNKNVPYVPYQPGELIVFRNKAGLKDTLRVSKYKLEQFVSVRHDCPYKQEKVECDFQTSWVDTLRAESNHVIKFFDWVLTQNTIVVSSDPIGIHATNFTPNDKGTMEELPSITFAGQAYSDVLLARCNSDSICFAIDSLGFVRDKGLAFYSFLGEQWVLDE